MDLDDLRARTREEHEATEALLPLMDDTLTGATYGRALAKLYSIVRGWELWAECHAPARFHPLLLDRKRSPLLLLDLEHLQVESIPNALPLSAFADLLDNGNDCSTDLTRTCHEARFAGAVYVVEGSTLGGQYIARHAEKVLGFRPGVGNAYFHGYGDQTGSHWREVKHALGALPEAMLEDAVDGAKRMFGIFARGLQ